MNIIRKIYKNNRYEGAYELIKYQDEYYWAYLSFSASYEEDRYKNYQRLNIKRSIDDVVLPNSLYSFKFEEGDI